jgi:hypothetical protein
MCGRSVIRSFFHLGFWVTFRVSRACQGVQMAAAT